MAITTSAKKAHRAGLRKKAFNDARKKALSLALKGVRLAQKGDTKAIAAAYQAIDKAMKRGLMTKNTAARRKAKVAKALSTK
ncbi:30S ribosomal protein S20 [Candidatus Kaiserbacteria bacterium]|nr:30S ribosomal protein S20 [Candidatus Kaiserbacteria bacterium]